MSFENHKWSETCTWSDLRGFKIQKFSGGHAPDPPRGYTATRNPIAPQMFSKYYLTTSFLNETLHNTIYDISMPLNHALFLCSSCTGLQTITGDNWRLLETGECQSHRLCSHSCNRRSKLWPALFSSLTVDHVSFSGLWPLPASHFN